MLIIDCDPAAILQFIVMSPFHAEGTSCIISIAQLRFELYTQFSYDFVLLYQYPRNFFRSLSGRSSFLPSPNE